MHVRTWKDPEIDQIQTQNQANWNDWHSRKSFKETWKQCPIKMIQTTTRVLLSLSLPVCLSAHTGLFFLLTNTGFTTFHLCANSFLQSQRARALSSTSGLVARIWYSHRHDPSLSLARNQSTASSCCRPRALEIKPWLSVVSSCYALVVSFFPGSVGRSQMEELFIL